MIPRHSPKPIDGESVPVRACPQDDLVTILQEAALLAVVQQQSVAARHSSLQAGCPGWQSSVPEMVPVPNRSPGRRSQPPLV